MPLRQRKPQDRAEQDGYHFQQRFWYKPRATGGQLAANRGLMRSRSRPRQRQVSMGNQLISLGKLK
ncbi:MAG: hypothetical protein WA876_02950 [Candidatus Acidiferrales bacterium]